MNTDGKKSRVRGGSPISQTFVITAISILSLVVILIFLVFFRVIDLSGFASFLFGTDSGEDYNNVEYGDIADIASPSDTNVVFESSTKTAYETLLEIEESPSYTRVVRMIFSHDDDSTIESCKIYKLDNKFRIESSVRTIIYDGESLYAKKSIYVYSEKGEFDFWREAGITSLSYLQISASEDNVKYKSKENTKTIVITIPSDESGTYDEYEVSTETGIVTAERCYINNRVYRFVITDMLETRILEFEEDTFKIPNN